MNGFDKLTTHQRFEKALRLLNSKQRQAVEALNGPVLVIAGPGTGKTHYYTLCKAKLPSAPPFEIHLFPEWVVVKDSQLKNGRDPKFNCNAFADKVKRGMIK